MKIYNNFKKLVPVIVLAGLVGFTACDSPTSNNSFSDDNSLQEAEASYSDAKKGNSKKIHGQYIVTFKKNVKDVGSEASQIASSRKGKIKYLYEHAIKGFTIQLPEQASARALQAIQNNPNVLSITEDMEVQAHNTQVNAPWGLDRSDQRILPLNDTYDYSSTGENVTVYIADSGINYSHEDFSGRASFGYDVFGGNGEDCDGHGTHVAGTAGGDQWGIAKNVDLVAVRVLNCNGSGTYSGVIAGVDWITANASGPSVVNMSLGGGASSALDSAIENSIDAGITYVVSAGNSSGDACSQSPARTPSAITVGSTTSSDSRSSFSNYGSCVDIFAPGSSIKSAHIGSSTATATMSGTSMASPHVAGAAALYLQSNSSATPAEIASALISNATQNAVSNSNTENNHLLYTIFDNSGGGENSAPTADFSFSTDYLNVQFTDGSSDSDGSISEWSWDFGDGASSSSANPSHAYGQAGTFSVSLTVTDDAGATDTVSKSVTVEEEPAGNAAPNASFTYSADYLNVQFTDGSSDSDGSIVSWSWDFGDGSTSSLENPSHSYSAAGSYSVSLTVTDDFGDTDTVQQTINVEEDVPNSAPIADFTFNTSDLSVQFTDGSSDPDGSIASRSWNFGDGSGSGSQNPSHTYSSAGTYSVSLTVTDNEGASDTVSKSVTVTEPLSSTINLQVNGFKKKGRLGANLSWNGATSSKVDIYRGGSRIDQTNNDGSYRDQTKQRGSGSLTYQVCEANTDTCSDQVTVDI